MMGIVRFAEKTPTLYIKSQGKTFNLPEKHRSDGNKLISAEVQANIRSDDIQLIATRFTVGYTTDDEGLINNYAIEPVISVSAYSLQQQRLYFSGNRKCTLCRCNKVCCIGR